MRAFIDFKDNFGDRRNTKFRKFKLLACGIFFLFSFSSIGYRTVSLAGVNKSSSQNFSFKPESGGFYEPLSRGNIYDRNKELLATTIITSSLNINPQEVLDKENTVLKLSKLFPQLNQVTLTEKLNTDKKFVNLLDLF